MNRILRTALLMLMAMALHTTAYAKVVDYSEALAVATDFFRANSMTAVALDNVKEVWNSTQLYQDGIAPLSATDTTPTFYVFAPETSKGFVVVSADDTTLPILGYSLDKEMLVGDEMPCNFRWWCEMMDKQVSILRETGAVSVKKAQNNGISTLAADEVLYETAEWNQYEPYNLQCPTYGGSRCVTGCVSTAFAIAMRYHQHPEKGIGQTEAYTTSSLGLSVGTRDLSAHTYDWDNMLLKYDGSYSDAQGDAVATLIADIGYLLKADYTTSGTGTSVGSTTSPRFYEHFNYSSSMYFVRTIAYDDDEWTALMKKEIEANGPVSYTSALLVHQFVLDGYNSNNYFHINWGWGGSNNGYFLLPDIVEGQDEQWAFMDFFPDDGKQETTLQVYGDGLLTDAETFSTNVSFTIGKDEVRVINVGAVDFTGYVAIGLTDSEGNIKELISNQIRAEGLGTYYTGKLNPLTCTITTTIEGGDCIRCCYKDNAADEWRCMGPFDSGTVYKIIITEDMIDEPTEHEYSLLMYTPGLSVDIEEFYNGVSFTASAYPANISGEEITTNLCYGLTDSEGNLKEWISNNILLSGLSSGYFSYVATDQPCTIHNGVEAGDRIRLFYQSIQGRDDTWKAIDSYYGTACPVEVIITEDMINENHEYSLLMYTPGLSVSIDEFYEEGCSFTATAYPANVSGEAVDTYLRFGLTDSSGDMKEWISDDMSFAANTGHYGSITNQPCTITNGVEVGDRIRLFYQGRQGRDDTWKAIDSYYDTPCPVEVEITKVIPTDIESVFSNINASDAIYTIQGVRVSNMEQKGIYIVGDKKILVK